MFKLRKNKKGFSLVELIVVIAIMAVLAGVVGGAIFGQLNKQKNSSADTEALAIANTIKTSIQASSFYGDEITEEQLADLLDEIIQDNEGVLEKIDAKPEKAANKAGAHKFEIYGSISDKTLSISICYYTVGGKAANAGRTIEYTPGENDGEGSTVKITLLA